MCTIIHFSASANQLQAIEEDENVAPSTVRRQGRV